VELSLPFSLSWCDPTLNSFPEPSEFVTPDTEDEVKLLLVKSDSSISGGRARLSLLLAALRAHQYCKVSLLIVCLGPGSKFQRSGFLSLARSRDRIPLPLRCFSSRSVSSASRSDGASSTLAVEEVWVMAGLCTASKVGAILDTRSKSNLKSKSGSRLSDASAERGISKLKPWSEEDGEIGVSRVGVVALGGAESRKCSETEGGLCHPGPLD